MKFSRVLQGGMKEFSAIHVRVIAVRENRCIALCWRPSGISQQALHVLHNPVPCALGAARTRGRGGRCAQHPDGDAWRGRTCAASAAEPHRVVFPSSTLSLQLTLLCNFLFGFSDLSY